MIISEKKVKVNSAESVFKVIRLLIDAERNEECQEHFYVIGLNNKNVIQYVDLISIGTVDSAMVHPRDIFRTAIMKNCSSVIIAHNHPSGIKDPSIEDVKMTSRVKEAGVLIGIPVIDHVIVVKDDYYSFNNNGVLS